MIFRSIANKSAFAEYRGGSIATHSSIEIAASLLLFAYLFSIFGMYERTAIRERPIGARQFQE